MGVASNVFTFAWGRQSARNVPVLPRYKMKVTGSDFQPVKDTDRIAETGTGRDGGERFTTRIHAEGGADQVLRPNVGVDLLHGVFGSLAHASASGTGEEHTATMADDQPYYTAYRYLGNTLIERFLNCKMGQLVVSGAAGGNVAAALTMLGGESRLMDALPANWSADSVSPAADAAVLDTDFPFRVPGVRYFNETVRKRTIRDFSITIAATQTPIQTDEVFDSYIEPGPRTIDVSHTELFQDLALYRKVLYASAASGNPRVSDEIPRGEWKAQFGNLTNGPGFEIVIPNLAYMTAPLTPDPGGDPLQMAVTGSADPVEGDSIVTARIVNELVAADYAVGVSSGIAVPA